MRSILAQVYSITSYTKNVVEEKIKIKWTAQCKGLSSQPFSQSARDLSF